MSRARRRRCCSARRSSRRPCLRRTATCGIARPDHPGRLHDNRVVVEVQGPLAINLGDAAVAAVVNHVGRADRSVDQEVAVHERGAVFGQVPDQRRGLAGIDEVQRPRTALDAVVANHGAGRAVLERHAARTLAQRADVVELEDRPDGFGVDVVVPVVGNLDRAVAVHARTLEQDVTRQHFLRVARGDEEAVAVAFDLDAAHHDVLTALDEDAGRVLACRAPCCPWNS